MVLVAAAVAALSLTLIPPLRGLWRFACAFFGLHFVTTLPFAARSFRADPAAGIVAPILITVRALSLAAGAIAGLFATFLLPQPQETVSVPPVTETLPATAAEEVL